MGKLDTVAQLMECKQDRVPGAGPAWPYRVGVRAGVREERAHPVEKLCAQEAGGLPTAAWCP